MTEAYVEAPPEHLAGTAALLDACQRTVVQLAPLRQIGQVARLAETLRLVTPDTLPTLGQVTAGAEQDLGRKVSDAIHGALAERGQVDEVFPPQTRMVNAGMIGQTCVTLGQYGKHQPRNEARRAYGDKRTVTLREVHDDLDQTSSTIRPELPVEPATVVNIIEPVLASLTADIATTRASIDAQLAPPMLRMLRSMVPMFGERILQPMVIRELRSSQSQGIIEAAARGLRTRLAPFANDPAAFLIRCVVDCLGPTYTAAGSRLGSNYVTQALQYHVKELNARLQAGDVVAAGAKEPATAPATVPSPRQSRYHTRGRRDPALRVVPSPRSSPDPHSAGYEAMGTVPLIAPWMAETVERDGGRARRELARYHNGYGQGVLAVRAVSRAMESVEGKSAVSPYRAHFDNMWATSLATYLSEKSAGQGLVPVNMQYAPSLDIYTGFGLFYSRKKVGAGLRLYMGIGPVGRVVDPGELHKRGLDPEETTVVLLARATKHFEVEVLRGLVQCSRRSISSVV
jgi:hypothetical protein